MADSESQLPEMDDQGRVIGARWSKVEQLRHRLGIGPKMPRRIHTISRWRRLKMRLLGRP